MLDDLESVLLSLVAQGEDKEWICLKCGKTAKTKQHIKSHAETHLAGVVANVCDFCGRKFKTSNTLQNHISLQHKKSNNLL